MHQIQKDLLSLSRNINLGERSLRDIGRLIGVEHPEKVKHHLKQLEKKGFLEIDRYSNSIRNINSDISQENKFINIPIVGSANCGPAQLLAEENIESYMKMSASLLNSGEYFAIRAVGDSMNKASIKGNCIDEGDYVIIDKSLQAPEEGEYMLVVLDGSAMIKRFHIDEENKMIFFLSESTHNYPPIVATTEDLDDIYMNGRVVRVVKTTTNLF